MAVLRRYTFLLRSNQTNASQCALQLVATELQMLMSHHVCMSCVATLIHTHRHLM